jgi:8-oxo-dGTP diphosphatase
MKTITVVAAIIQKGPFFLCTQRGPNKYTYIHEKYEFPGGKVETGESESEALIREIKEELDMEILVSEKYLTVDHTYPDFRLIMHSYLCIPLSQEVHLKEHIAYQWLSTDQFPTLDWAAADVPIVEALVSEAWRWK